MSIPFSNDEQAVSGTTRVPVEFLQTLPVQLEIKTPMKTSAPPKPLTPSLFQIAASVENVSPAAAKSPFAPLPLDDWTFSRDRLERALKARLSKIKNRAAPAGEPVAKQPLLQIARRSKKIGQEARPVQHHPFGTVNAMVEAA
jgi:hypothetical protein